MNNYPTHTPIPSDADTLTIETHTLSYPLGSDDIGNIVDALLTALSPFLTGLTKEQIYVLLHKAVLSLSKGKTFTNKDELDKIVKDIVKLIVTTLTNRANKLSANADDDGVVPARGESMLIAPLIILIVVHSQFGVRHTTLASTRLDKISRVQMPNMYYNTN